MEGEGFPPPLHENYRYVSVLSGITDHLLILLILGCYFCHNNLNITIATKS